jgi:transposase
MIAAVRSELSVNEPVLYVAFELSKKEWKLGLTSGFGVPALLRTVPAGDVAAVRRTLQTSGARLGLPADAPVVSCYEAGRDGFWIHRALTQLGIANRVVDSSSIEVNRRARRTKTDRLDALKLVMMLVRVCQGERRVWCEVRVPTTEAEAARHGSRERTALRQEQTRVRNQIGSWLATWGCAVSMRTRRQAAWWTQVRDWAGEALPAAVQARIARAEARLAVLVEQVTVLETAQTHATRTSAPTTARRRLVQLRGVGATSAAILLDEGLAWREFRNRRQVGGLLGFAPTHYASGEVSRDQGIRRAGNKRLQSVMVQLAWGWLQWQPTSALSEWYRQRFDRGKRARKVGIVALARKLCIALWRYATAGVLPAGAIVTTA